VFKGGWGILKRGKKICQGWMPGVAGLGPEGQVGKGQAGDKVLVCCKLLGYPDLFPLLAVQGENGQDDEEEGDATEKKACPYHLLRDS